MEDEEGIIKGKRLHLNDNVIYYLLLRQLYTELKGSIHSFRIGDASLL